MIITFWSVAMLILVLVPAGVLLLVVGLTWIEASKAGEAAVAAEHEPHA